MYRNFVMFRIYYTQYIQKNYPLIFEYFRDSIINELRTCMQIRIFIELITETKCRNVFHSLNIIISSILLIFYVVLHVTCSLCTFAILNFLQMYKNQKIIFMFLFISSMVLCFFYFKFSAFKGCQWLFYIISM